jgi:hypothetical protein
VTRFPLRLILAAAVILAVPPAASAQDDDAAVLDLAQPDFTLVSLPTTLRVPTMGSAFRVTHRFTRSLGEGDFSDLLNDFFGLDSSGVIGLEYRFGILPNVQIGVHRSNLDKVIEFFGHYSVLRQPSAPVDVTALFSIDGTNNFRDSYSPALGAVVSRRIGDVAALYLQPIWVNNSSQEPAEVVDDNDSMLLGMGARVRIRPTVYLVGEFAPRVAGNDEGTHHGGFAIEKRAGGHLFQLNFTTSFATTPGQLARGGAASDAWYIGFNISRKFF